MHVAGMCPELRTRSFTPLMADAAFLILDMTSRVVAAPPRRLYHRAWIVHCVSVIGFWLSGYSTITYQTD
jgi:hypothetical protein